MRPPFSPPGPRGDALQRPGIRKGRRCFSAPLRAGSTARNTSRLVPRLTLPATALFLWPFTTRDTTEPQKVALVAKLFCPTDRKGRFPRRSETLVPAPFGGWDGGDSCVRAHRSRERETADSRRFSRLANARRPIAKDSAFSRTRDGRLPKTRHSRERETVDCRRS